MVLLFALLHYTNLLLTYSIDDSIHPLSFSKKITAPKFICPAQCRVLMVLVNDNKEEDREAIFRGEESRVLMMSARRI